MFQLRRNFLILMLLGISILFMPCHSGEPDMVVSLEDNSGKVPPKTRQDGHPVKFAIAAMISPRQTFEIYEQLVDYLDKRIPSGVELVQRKTYQEVNKLLENREIDLAWVCTGAYIAGSRKFGMQIVTVPTVNKKPVYHGYVIVRSNSPHAALTDLRGHAFAFTDPMSLTGNLYPLSLLREISEDPDTFFSRTIYTHSHDNSIIAVQRAVVDAAGVDSLVYDFYAEREPKRVAGTRILVKSPPFGIPPIVVHPEITSEVKDRFRDMLIHMHEDSEGASILSNLRIDRFMPPGEADYSSAAPIVFKGTR